LAAPKSRKKTKKREKVEAHGKAHIKSTFNNTIITLSDSYGNTISWASAGRSGFKGSRKNTPFAAQIAAENAAKLLAEFRNNGMPVIHVRHNSDTEGEIHKLVEPLPGENVISKNEVNCFAGTDLLNYLKANGITNLVICGMQTHMCVEAAVRAAADLGFTCLLIKDACATKDLKFDEKVIKAEDVHYSTLATLRSYASIESTGEFLIKQQK